MADILKKNLRVLVVGCGNMGASHAKAYHGLDYFTIVGLVSRSNEKLDLLKELIGDYPSFNDFDQALKTTSPDVVSINTYPDTHASFAIKSMHAGAHVFLEKPLAETAIEAQKVIDVATNLNRKLVIGYILRVHPAWKLFISEAKKLGKPLVMRMNLNQQSSSSNWETHKNLMHSLSPIVDCGVHYLDVMCQMTMSKPISVHAIGARLSDQIPENMYNYGQLQVAFEDGSIGWYEAGWGPMMSETAYFIKDVIGPHGAVSIVNRDHPNSEGTSQDIDLHTQTSTIKLHSSKLKKSGHFEKKDIYLTSENEPDHDALCRLEQQYLADAIFNDRDLLDHMMDALNSLKVVLAADESVKTQKKILL